MTHVKMLAKCEKQRLGLSTQPTINLFINLKQNIMNKARRNEISAIIERLEACKSDLEALQEEEQDCFDNLPETLQDSERGEAMQENADDLEDACDSLDTLIENLQEVVER